MNYVQELCGLCLQLWIFLMLPSSLLLAELSELSKAKGKGCKRVIRFCSRKFGSVPMKTGAQDWSCGVFSVSAGAQGIAKVKPRASLHSESSLQRPQPQAQWPGRGHGHGERHTEWGKGRKGKFAHLAYFSLGPLVHLAVDAITCNIYIYTIVYSIQYTVYRSILAAWFGTPSPPPTDLTCMPET